MSNNKQLDNFDEAFDCALDILEENSEGFMALAVRNSDHSVRISGNIEYESLARVFAKAMSENKTFGDAVVTAVVIYATEHGESATIELPPSPSLN